MEGNIMEDMIREAVVEICKELGKEITKEVKEKVIEVTKELVGETITKDNVKAGVKFLVQKDNLDKIGKCTVFAAVAILGVGFIKAIKENKKEKEQIDLINNPEDIMNFFA
jgi:hypothetical protein